MFTVYSEKETFENIVLFNEQYPNWFNILSNHSEICLNVTKEELNQEKVPETIIFTFIHMNGGKCPIDLEDFFDEIYENNEVIAQKPRAAFFLNYSEEESLKLQEDYGVIVQSKDAIDDKILGYEYFKELESKVQWGRRMEGWNELLKIEIPPSNSLIVSDEYLLTNVQRVSAKNVNVGFENLKLLFDRILPENLKIPYHITILSYNKDRDEAWRVKIAEDLDSFLKTIRSYEFQIEIIYIKPQHKRSLVMNYINASCDRGFTVFSAHDYCTVKDDNDIRFNRVFQNIHNCCLGDCEFKSATIILSKMQKECRELVVHLQDNATWYKGDIINNYGEEKTFKNRLFNAV
jgi:hypothetical protein